MAADAAACNKIEDADTGEIHDTNVACKLLDTGTAQCSDYRNRKAFVPDCLRLNPADCRAGYQLAALDLRLPACAPDGRPLP